MVLLHVKRSETSLFLYETTVSQSLGELIPALAHLQNQRLRIQRLVEAAKDLIEYGPLKPLNEHGYSEEQLDELAKEKETVKTPMVKDGMAMLWNPDPTGRRTGEAPNEEMARVLQKTLDNATAASSTDLVQANKALKLESLEEAIAEVKGAVTIVYPMGLPEWEPVREILEDREDLTGTAASKEVFDPKETTLWWANKELLPEKTLSDYIGRNEKTKIIAKLQKKGYGAPVREAPMDERAQKEMMAYYYKKQEEHKKLLENDEDDYINSTWANPKALKAAFNGMGNVSFGPRR